MTLSRALRAGEARLAEAARRRLIESNLRLVVSVARRHLAQAPAPATPWTWPT